MADSKPSARINRCPQCGKSCRTDKENSFRPFCSERCKMIDLGDWLDERHRISEPVNHWGPGDEAE
ncbi:MAG: DNA gyrase inhibitor YacG [Salinisphaeraceae bacterium]|nr:DNA gyrase inhibitor YacG [Salinisphaeraceae bacterium]